MILQLLVALLLAGVAEAKDVVIEYDSFLKMIAMKEHVDKTANKLAAENAVLVKLKDEQGTIIKVQAEQIQACEAIVQQQEKLGSTQEQLSQAVEGELTQQLTREKRLSRYKSELVWLYLGIITMAAFLY